MISLIVPSRGRPDNLLRLWHSAIETAVDVDDVEMIVRIDEDDRSYDALRSRGARGQIRWVVGPRYNEMVLHWNEAAAQARGDLLWHGGDDNIFRTEAWDQHVKLQANKLPADGIGLIYGRDGAHDQNLATHPFLTREWVNGTGYFLPPYFSCDFADLWNFNIAAELGRAVFVPEIYIEHMHPALGKAEVDQTTTDRLTRDVHDNNTQRWLDLQPELHQWTDKLRAACSG